MAERKAFRSTATTRRAGRASVPASRMLAAVAALCVAAAMPLYATTYTWTGGGTPDGSGAYAWDSADNWGGSGYPVAGDIAIIDAAGCTIAILSGGAKLSRIYARSGEWRMTGSGTLDLTDQFPFQTATATYDQRVALITFDCPVKFSNTGDKKILSGNIFNNTVTLGTTGRAFFSKGDAAGASVHCFVEGRRTPDIGLSKSSVVRSPMSYVNPLENPRARATAKENQNEHKKTDMENRRPGGGKRGTFNGGVRRRTARRLYAAAVQQGERERPGQDGLYAESNGQDRDDVVSDAGVQNRGFSVTVR